MQYIMNQLVKVSTNSQGNQVVSARDLHEYLGAGSNVNTWFKNQAERAMLEDGIDFIQILEQSTGGRPSIDYALTLSSAKEISMLNGGEKGKEARRYFIDCEANLKQLTSLYTEIGEHTKRPVQITAAKNANAFAFEKLSGKYDAIEWNRKVAFEFTNMTPSQLKDLAKSRKVPYKQRTSGKDVIRLFSPERAVAIALADKLHSMGEPDDVAISIAKGLIPMAKVYLKHKLISY
jgi:phage anti-repressor protein